MWALCVMGLGLFFFQKECTDGNLITMTDVLLPPLKTHFLSQL